MSFVSPESRDIGDYNILTSKIDANQYKAGAEENEH